MINKEQSKRHNRQSGRQIIFKQEGDKEMEKRKRREGKRDENSNQNLLYIWTISTQGMQMLCATIDTNKKVFKRLIPK